MKTESIKNRTVCSNLYSNHTYATPKILKNKNNLGNLSINLLQKELVFYHVLLKIRIILLIAKVSIFQQDQTTITQEDPKGITWHFIETKAIKHD